MLFLVLKMILINEAGLPVEVLCMVFTSTGGNTDGFKGLRGIGCKAVGD